MKGWKTPWQYSRPTFIAFVVLIAVYIVIVWMLWGLQHLGAMEFRTNISGDLLPLAASLPFVALYILVFVAATAGFARAAIMAKELPFGQIMQSELKKRTMGRSTIMTKIRSAATVRKDTPFLEALLSVTTARLPILPVVGDKGKVEGVITANDILKRLYDEVGKAVDIQKIKDIKVKDLNPRPATTVAESETLDVVLQKMISNQFTKLIVVKDAAGEVYSGTIDVMDITGEIAEGASGE